MLLSSKDFFGNGGVVAGALRNDVSFFVIASASEAIHSGVMKQPAVYIMASQRYGTLYIGVSGDLIRRAYEHRNHLNDGFTKRYHCIHLVWYELHESMESAILREKQLKAGSRQKKINLIEQMNLDWVDLYDTLLSS